MSICCSLQVAQQLDLVGKMISAVGAVCKAKEAYLKLGETAEDRVAADPLHAKLLGYWSLTKQLLKLKDKFTEIQASNLAWAAETADNGQPEKVQKSLSELGPWIPECFQGDMLSASQKALEDLMTTMDTSLEDLSKVTLKYDEVETSWRKDVGDNGSLFQFMFWKFKGHCFHMRTQWLYYFENNAM